MFFLTSLIILICGGVSLALQRRLLSFAPLPFFVICSMLFALSTAYATDTDQPGDLEHLWLIIVYFVSILLYSVLFLDHNRSRTVSQAWRSTPWINPAQEPVRKMIALLIVSAAVAIFYYKRSVGYNLFWEAILGSDIDYVTMRLESYSGGSGYSGIVNQFKNTVLPILYFSLVSVIYRRRNRNTAILIAIFIAPFFLWTILGTGQRTFFFFSMASLLLYLDLAGRLKFRYLFIALAVFLPIFAMQSVLLGRSQSIGVVDALSQFGWRLFGSNQMATVLGFRYVATLPVQFGAEWGKTLLGFIPGFAGSDLSNQIHYIAFRSMRGTAPVSLWVSIYHNFGMVGVLPVMIILMKTIEKVGYLILKLPKSELGMCVWGFFIFYVAIIPAANIFQIIVNGLPALLLLLLVFWNDLRVTLRRILYGRSAHERQPDGDPGEDLFR